MVNVAGHGRMEELGSAAAGIAHDLNNQLTLILNQVEAEDLNGVRSAALKCADLTTTLLAFCRGESVKLRSVDPVAFLDNYVEGLRLPQGVALVVDVPASLPSIAADATALARAIDNLVLNACAAMDGQGTLGIIAREYAITVADTGPGIPADDHTKIFEVFYTSKGKHGTGLGLAIVRDIMRQHSGSVSVESQAGQGAAFTLRFRVRPALEI